MRQAVAAGLGFVGFLVALAIDPDRYRRAQKGIYAVTLILMLLVFPARGHNSRLEALDRARRFPAPAVRVRQAALRARAGGLLADRARRIHEPQVVLQTVGLALVPILLVFKQPDLGTALVHTMAVAACLFVSGIRWSHFAVLASIAALVVASVVWFLPGAGIDVLEPYQTARLTGFTNPDSASVRLDLQRHPVDHGGRLGRSERPRRRGCDADPSRLPPRPPPNFVFAASLSSVASSVPRSCSASTSSSSGAACA